MLSTVLRIFYSASQLYRGFCQITIGNKDPVSLLLDFCLIHLLVSSVKQADQAYALLYALQYTNVVTSLYSFLFGGLIIRWGIHQSLLLIIIIT